MWNSVYYLMALACWIVDPHLAGLPDVWHRVLDLEFVQEELHIPLLQIETDYSDADTEQLKVRIEVFFEML